MSRFARKIFLLENFPKHPERIDLDKRLTRVMLLERPYFAPLQIFKTSVHDFLKLLDAEVVYGVIVHVKPFVYFDHNAFYGGIFHEIGFGNVDFAAS